MVIEGKYPKEFVAKAIRKHDLIAIPEFKLENGYGYIRTVFKTKETEIGFIYLSPDGIIAQHKHTDDMETYTDTGGERKVEVCLKNDKHLLMNTSSENWAIVMYDKRKG